MLGNRCFFRKDEIKAWEESRKSTHHLKRTGVKPVKSRPPAHPSRSPENRRGICDAD
jgi:hypothetical protein